MNDQIKDATGDCAPESSETPVNVGRRRLGTLGAGGAAVALSVTSKSAVAGWGTCTGSEIASGNLSRKEAPNPCGCSPGYWWNSNGQAKWNDPAKYPMFAPYLPLKTFKEVFGVDFFLDTTTTLLQVASKKNRSYFKPPFNANSVPASTAFHAVAALLNAAYYGNRYPVLGLNTGPAVIASFKAACVGGTLETWVSSVDVYTSKNTWCFGDPHTTP